jgi:hypothetical protein
MDANDDPLASGPPFGDLLDAKTAKRLTDLARSSRSEDVDLLIQVGMTRGLRHPRFAVEAIEAQLGQQFARQSVTLAEQSVKLARLLLWVALLAAIAAVANVVAVVVA